MLQGQDSLQSNVKDALRSNPKSRTSPNSKDLPPRIVTLDGIMQNDVVPSPRESYCDIEKSGKFIKVDDQKTI